MIAGVMTSIMVVQFDYGKHIYDIPPTALVGLLHLANISGTIAVLAAAWSKTSFALTMLRVTKGWTHALVWWIIVSMNVFMHLTIVFLWIPCSLPGGPAPDFPQPAGGICLPPRTILAYSMFSGVYSAGMDFLLALLPWKIVWAAKLQRRERFGVCIAMSMGVL